jgi:hypothetical protein
MSSKTHRRALSAALVLLAVPAYAGIDLHGRELRVNRRNDFKQVNPSAAFSPTGGALIAWENDQRGIRGLFYGTNGWPSGPEVTLVESAGAETLPYVGPVVNPRQPAALFFANGDVLLAWTEETGFLNSTHFYEERRVENQDIYVRRFSASGAPAGAKTRVNTTTAGLQHEPRLIARNGGFLVVWEDDASGGIVGRALGGAGQPLGSEIAISTTAGRRPAAAANSQGKVLVSWEANDGSGAGVFARLLDAAAKPVGSELRVNTDTAHRQGRPAIAAAKNGDFLVAWQGEQPEIYTGFFNLYGQAVGADGKLEGKQLRLYQGPLAAGNPQISPALVAAPGGGFLLTWLSWPNDYDFGVAGLELSNAGAPAGSAFWIAAAKVQAGFRELTVAASGAGRFLVSWESPLGTRAGIAARRLIAD